MLYTAAVKFPFMVTIFYWLKLYADSQIPDESIHVRILRLVVLISVNGTNSIIALLEIIILSGVR